MTTGSVIVIQRWLEESKAHRGANRDYEDKAIFLSWKHGEINTSECKKRFFEANDFPEYCNVAVTDAEFEMWLRSEGW